MSGSVAFHNIGARFSFTGIGTYPARHYPVCSLAGFGQGP
ncbi:hypothetical protein D3OALGA1CA_5171 [Olavius algarvensis associated proteobacterium Delta 3]|nr:hypothetical protein D3OALGB2SA_2719 [Olavius algarvensis associated proteobacterium Delta 3]CAB5162940.1 hypothetical protein D3OALGA1CA_5171 [Olavius algarvensis associated proteobacterium Delta 3]